MRRTTSGFTIVELLIVIVIIAILAAITIVAYNGIQERSYDTRMASDMSNAARHIKIYQVDNDRYPSSNPSVTGARFSFSPVVNNVLLCASNANQDAGFSIVARDPKRPSVWYHYDSTTNQTNKYTPTGSDTTGLCAPTGKPALLWGAFWVQGG